MKKMAGVGTFHRIRKASSNSLDLGYLTSESEPGRSEMSRTAYGRTLTPEPYLDFMANK